MGTVTGIFCRCPADNSGVFYKVITVTVTFVAVAVFIFCRTYFFGFVGPHVANQIRVVPHYTFIKYCYNDGRVSFTQFPSFTAIYVCTGNSFGTFFYKIVAARVLVMPLVFQSRVVEGQSFAGTSHMLQIAGREVQRFFLRVVGTPDGRVALNLGDFTQLSELPGSFFQVGVFVKANDIPQVHTCFAGTFFCFGIYREHSFKVIGTQDVEHLIGRRNTRAGGYPASTRQCLVQDITHFRNKLDE